MFSITDPNLIVGGYAAAGIGIYLLWRLIVWIRDSPTHPDPWEADVAQKLVDPDAPEICPHCSTPQSPSAWFCEHCGRAVGPYNNLMPYVNVFSEGEVFRNGVSERFRNRRLILIGFVLISISSYFVLAPVYLFLLLRNWRRSAAEQNPAADAQTH